MVGAAGVAMAGYVGLPHIAAYVQPRLRFEPLPGVEGFRQLAGGALSGGNPALLGIGAPPPHPPEGSVCASLFAQPGPAGHVPVAYFSDARCIYCRVLSPLLHELETTEPISITWHELPLLGAASMRAARASLAARRQSAYTIFHDRLMGTPFLPTEGYLRELAKNAGIDVDQLLRDMVSDEVSDEIARTAMLARRFGFYGTPALVVGRTATLGALDERTLRRLIEIERNEAEPGPCA
jgi:protein-disulfide isomerase